MPRDVDNGILLHVPGEFCAAGSRSLEPAERHQGAVLTAEVDTGALWLGVVRIRYRSARMRHGKDLHWSWVAVHAEKV